MGTIFYRVYKKSHWGIVQKIIIKDIDLINYGAIELIRVQIEQKLKTKVMMDICIDER